MANIRKLLGEIDRTIKKVNDGIDYFDTLWDKLYAAPSRKLKEKYEEDLKKEIKKLQRFREQIKVWISNPDIKNKTALIDARNVVEDKMQQFKICERETKTKAYSKEGLAQATALDPMEAEKQRQRDWIQDMLNNFQQQIENFESELERLNSGKSKRQNRSEISQLEVLDKRHKWHITKLEQVTRLLDNDALVPKDIDEIKDDVEYYLEANMEADFMENYGEDDVYEPLRLDSFGTGSANSGGDYTDTHYEASTTGGGYVAKEITLPQASPKTGKSVTTKISASVSKTIKVVTTEPKRSPQRETTLKYATAAATGVQKRASPRTVVEKTKSGETKQDKVGKKMANAVETKVDPLTEKQQKALQILEFSAQTIPTAADSDRVKPYAVRTPYTVPSCYPTSPSEVFENPQIFEKFDTDTLFFIFYFQQGTFQQYLAARELKKQTWAYHKKYMTWFKRHEDPKKTCDEYEQGTYVYFDYETGWCQRIKSEFTFEYSYLEDELTL